ncbi:glycine receptor subunit alpha-1, partial [Aplysia californica]|uniref:Glycine receptor subunit alpha-1 n=1 Tax=Aplysia californica TaxID=6500 RepID=A0ABM1VP83_APLCA
LTLPSRPQQDFSLNVFLTQTWLDTRLQFHDLIDAEYLELDSKLTNKFWVPDLYFVNEKSSSFHSVTVPNRLLHLYSDGTVVYKLRYTYTLTNVLLVTLMYTQSIPASVQLWDAPCLILSYLNTTCLCVCKSCRRVCVLAVGYSNNSLQFQWSEEIPLSRHDDLEMSQFSLVSLSNRHCDEGVEDGGAHTCLAVDVSLQRSVGFYMIQLYVPSALVVFLSWVSFCLDPSAVPARISLGILTVLTMTNMKTIAVSSLPKVSYIKAIDVWMATCLAFVFASLIEFAVVNAFARRIMSQPQEHNWTPLVDAESAKSMKPRPSPTRPRQPGSDQSSIQLARFIDRASMIFFPVLFLAFVAGYILVYQ